MKFAPSDIEFCPLCGHRLEPQVRHGQPRPVCPACHFIHFANPRVAVVIFATEANRMVLVKRGSWPEKGKWALPAGFVDFGEAPENAAIREMKEETGLDITIERFMQLSFDPISQAIVLLYKAAITGGALKADDDAMDARWFTREDLPELAFDTTHQAVKAWQSGTLV